MTTRPVERGWSCKRSGDCCRIPKAVVMTASERLVLMAHPAATGLQLQWDPNPDHKWWALRAGPCPFLKGNACSVYESRPTNCRLFGCFRPNPAVEPFDASGPVGCRNLSDRFTAREVRKGVKRLMAKARTWAIAHGWTVK